MFSIRQIFRKFVGVLDLRQLVFDKFVEIAGIILSARQIANTLIAAVETDAAIKAVIGGAVLRKWTVHL